MPVQLRWVGEADLDRVADTRMLCFAHGSKEIDRFREGIRADPRGNAGDFLLAEQGGVGVGTATSLSMTMWARGSPLPCQGVAFVGTIKSHRRRTDQGDGIATQLMNAALCKARERAQVVSALMPFRGSFYEHFGYGFVERRNEWTVPLSILPRGGFDGFRYVRAEDANELAKLRTRTASGRQCDIERPADVWAFLLKRADGGYVMVDQADPGGPIRGYIWVEHALVGTKDQVRVVQNDYEDVGALKRQIHWLASLRDQYAAATITLPSDLPLNLLLKETQVPHRLVNHAAAELRPYTRMQLRVLDSKRLIEAMGFPPSAKGRAGVVVQESDGGISRFSVDFSDGRAAVGAAGSSSVFACSDCVWAAVVCGDLPATRAVQLGLASADDPRAASVLDAFAIAPAPFCVEYF